MWSVVFFDRCPGMYSKLSKDWTGINTDCFWRVVFVITLLQAAFIQGSFPQFSFSPWWGQLAESASPGSFSADSSAPQPDIVALTFTMSPVLILSSSDCFERKTNIVAAKNASLWASLSMWIKCVKGEWRLLLRSAWETRAGLVWYSGRGYKTPSMPCLLWEHVAVSGSQVCCSACPVHPLMHLFTEYILSTEASGKPSLMGHTLCYKEPISLQFQMTNYIKEHRSNHSAGGTQGELLGRQDGWFRHYTERRGWTGREEGEKVSKERTSCPWRMKAPGALGSLGPRLAGPWAEAEGGGPQDTQRLHHDLHFYPNFTLRQWEALWTFKVKQWHEQIFAYRS